MSRTWWIYPTRRFAVDCLRCQVRSRAKGDGLHSSLEVGGEIVAFDHTPNFGAEAVRNHNLEWVLPDGRVLDVDLGWMGVWTTGIVVRINGQTVYESHPGRAPAYPESLRENVVTYTSAGDVWAKALHGDRGDGAGPLAAGIFARHNRLPLAVDVVTGLLFYMIAKLVDLQTSALFGIVIGVGLIVFQRITGIDVTGGMVLFGTAAKLELRTPIEYGGNPRRARNLLLRAAAVSTDPSTAAMFERAARDVAAAGGGA